MTQIHYTSKKTGKQFMFEVQLHWLEDSLGIVEAADVHGHLHVATPEKFGGKGNEWSAEHLLLGAITGSFMSTYLAYAKKAGFEIAHLECSAIGQVKPVNARYRFVHIDVYPIIYIVDRQLKEKAAAILAKSEKNCLVANSMNADVFFHSKIITEEQNWGKHAVERRQPLRK